MRMTVGELRRVIREEVMRIHRSGLRESVGEDLLEKSIKEVKMWWNSLPWDPDETPRGTSADPRPGLRWSSPKEVVAWNLLSPDGAGRSVLMSPIPEGDSYLEDMEELISDPVGSDLPGLWESRRHLFNYAKMGGSNFTPFVKAMDEFCAMAGPAY